MGDTFEILCNKDGHSVQSLKLCLHFKMVVFGHFWLFCGRKSIVHVREDFIPILKKYTKPSIFVNPITDPL